MLSVNSKFRFLLVLVFFKFSFNGILPVDAPVVSKEEIKKYVFLFNKINVEYVSEMNGFLPRLSKTAIVSIPALICGGFVCLGLFEIEAFKNLTFQYKKEVLVFVVLITAGVLSKIYIENPIRDMVKNNCWVDVFENFLKNYNPDIINGGNDNYKLCVPEKLYESFDKLHEAYSKNGKECLKKEFLNLIKDIAINNKSILKEKGILADDSVLTKALKKAVS